MITFTPLEGRVILTDFVQPYAATKSPTENANILRELADIWRNLNGTPRFRVSYGEATIKTRGGDQILAYRKKTPKRIQTGWAQGNNRYPMSTDTNLLPKDLPIYPINRIIWEGLPCWILEEWESPEILAAEWEPRYKRDRDGNIIDWMGPVPRTGCYRAVAYIHDGHWGYVPLPEALPRVVRGLLDQATKSRVENPYLENTPDLIEARLNAINQELNEAEERNVNALAAEFTEELFRNAKFRDDLEVALHSEVDYHKKRAANAVRR